MELTSLVRMASNSPGDPPVRAFSLRITGTHLPTQILIWILRLSSHLSHSNTIWRLLLVSPLTNKKTSAVRTDLPKVTQPTRLGIQSLAQEASTRNKW